MIGASGCGNYESREHSMSDTNELRTAKDGSNTSDLAAAAEENTSLGRRAFLRNTGLTTLGAMVGMSIPFEGNIPSGVLPVMAQDTGEELMPDKPDLIMLNDRPLNVETPAHLLDDEVTPYSRMFVRNNGLVPDTALNMDAE